MEKNKYKKLGVVVEGGAMRGIFASGFFDSFLESNYNPFHLAVGVSAGSTNLASYLARFHGRNYKIFTTYSRDKHFINFFRGLRGGHIMDLDWLWEVTLRELAIDNNLVAHGPTQYFIGMTCAKTGDKVYMRPTSDQVNVVAKASSALPILYRNPVLIDGHPYYDGGVAAPIPYDKAIEEGCDHLVIIRSRKKDFRMAPSSNRIAPKLLRRYPSVIKATQNRWQVYNSNIDEIRNGFDAIRIDEVNPPDSFKTERLTKDLAILEKDYELGRVEGKRMLKLLKDMDYKNLWETV